MALKRSQITLTDEEINAIHGRVAARVGAELGLSLRGS